MELLSIGFLYLARYSGGIQYILALTGNFSWFACTYSNKSKEAKTETKNFVITLFYNLEFKRTSSMMKVGIVKMISSSNYQTLSDCKENLTTHKVMDNLNK